MFAGEGEDLLVLRQALFNLGIYLDLGSGRESLNFEVVNFTRNDGWLKVQKLLPLARWDNLKFEFFFENFSCHLHWFTAELRVGVVLRLRPFLL